MSKLNSIVISRVSIFPMPAPAQCSRVLYSTYSNDCTLVALNVCCIQRTNSPASDNNEGATQLSIDIKPSVSDRDDASEGISIEIFLPRHTLTWGGNSTNKTKTKREQRIAEQAKRRNIKEVRDPRFKSREIGQ